MRAPKPGLTLLAGIAAFLLSACGGGGGGGSSSSGGGQNTPPTANAGAAQSVTSGVTVTLNGSVSSDPDGSIATYAWTQTVGTTVVLSSVAAAQPTFVAPTVAASTTLTFSLVVTDNQGAASAASTVNITVNPPVAGNVNVTGQVTFARVNFATAGQDPDRGLWYAAPVQQPARGILVRAINANTQVPVPNATATTDDSGNYSLSVPSNLSVNIQAVAHMQRSGSPSWDIRVQDGVAGNSPYSYLDPAAVNSGAGVTKNVAIPTGINASGSATGTRFSGPFAVLDTLYSAIVLVRTAEPNANFPALIVDWGSQTTGTFFSTENAQHIALLSTLGEDTDEFDQHVVAHEFGHYIEYNFSRADNIGGSHGLGDRLDPRVAFGEGFGYAFAAMVLNDASARDSFVDNGNQVSGAFNVQDNPPAPNDPTGCWCSESSVWSILYDLFDSDTEAGDSLALGFEPLWDVLVGNQRTTPAFTTVFSFTTALKAARPGDAAAINSLVSAQNIVAASIDAFGTTETNVPTGVPSNAVFPIYTSATIGGGAVAVNSSDNAGRGNKVGTHRYIRFEVASTRNVTISMTTSNTDANRDPDFLVWRNGELVAAGVDPPQQTETETFQATAGTYIIDAYDCANGCGSEEGVPGDYVLTVTVN